MALTILNFSCVFFFLTGMHMTPHHYQFLTPLLAFNLTLLASFKQHKKIITPLLLLCILMQGSFSYWRAYSEYKKPYVTDIGYSDQFKSYFTNNCKADSTAYILDPRGLHFFQSSKGNHTIIIIMYSYTRLIQLLESLFGIQKAVCYRYRIF